MGEIVDQKKIEEEEVVIWFLKIENSQDKKMVALLCKLSIGIK